MSGVMVVFSIAEWCWAYGNYLLIDVYGNNGCATIECAPSGGSESGNFKGQIYKGARNPEIDFVNGKGKSTLIIHADKHSYASPEEYLKDARNFMEKQSTSTTQSFVSSEGTYFRYDTATNEFGIINQYGGISTYFKLDEGIIYWLEQIEKYAPK